MRSSTMLVLAGLLGGATAAPAATVSTGDLGYNVISDAGDFVVAFDLTGLVDGFDGTLAVLYGLWNSPDVLVSVIFNGVGVGSFLADGGYISPGPEFIDFEVDGLVVDGVNEVLFTSFGASDGDYVVGQVALTYDEVAPVPLPASLPLLAAAMLGAVGLTRRPRLR